MSRTVGIQCPASGEIVAVGYSFGRLTAVADYDEGTPMPETIDWVKRVNGRRFPSKAEAADWLCNSMDCEADDLYGWDY